MDFKKALRFPFQGENWIKNLLIGSGLMLTGFGSFILQGYGLEIVREMSNTQSDDNVPPSWTNIGENITDALKILVVSFVWSLPILLIVLIYAVFIIILTSTVNVDPDTINTLAIISQILYLIAIIVLSLGLSGFMPAITGEVATKQTIKAGLDFNKIYALTKGHYFKNILATLALAIVFVVIVPLGIIACGVGVLATSTYAYDVMFHVYGQLYMDMVQKTQI